jgi:hypothetical protein
MSGNNIVNNSIIRGIRDILGIDKVDKKIENGMYTNIQEEDMEIIKDKIFKKKEEEKRLDRILGPKRTSRNDQFID